MVQQVRLRRHLPYVIGIVVLGILAGICDTVLIVLLLIPNLTAAAIVVAFSVLTSWALIGQIRVGVVADAGGLILHQLFRTRRIRWQDIERISPATDDVAKYVGVITKDGRRIRCAALGAGRLERSARLNSYVDELNAFLREAQAVQKSVPRQG